MTESPRPIPGWKPSTPPMTGEEARTVLAQHRVALVHFWAEWDGYDQVADRDLEPLREEFGDRVFFCSCCTDDKPNWPFIRECKVFGVPALVCFVCGERLPKSFHYRHLEPVRAALTEALERDGCSPDDG